MWTSNASTRCSIAAFSLALAWSAPTASASMIITVAQIGPNVIMTASGAINTASLLLSSSAGGFVPSIQPNAATIQFGAYPTFSAEQYTGATAGPANFGPGAPSDDGIIYASSGSGSSIIFSPGQLWVPIGYISGAALSASATYDNATLASLGISPGTYTWTWGNGPTADSFTVTTVIPPLQSRAL
jgi:hypothetical protein